MGLFEENIFDVTFRKAIEETGSEKQSMRRMISIQDENTLHTPHIPLHLYKSAESSSVGSREENKSSVPRINKRKQSAPRKRRKERDLDVIVPPPSSSNAAEIISRDAIPIPIQFPDSIQIQPKWTVVLQYPVVERIGPTEPIKQRLKQMLVKNESRREQCITLKPLQPSIEEQPATESRVIKEGEEFVQNERVPIPKKPPRVAPDQLNSELKSFSAVERNNAATKRYREKKKEFQDRIISRNKQLETENKRLKLENMILKEKLEALLEQRGKV